MECAHRKLVAARDQRPVGAAVRERQAGVGGRPASRAQLHRHLAVHQRGVQGAVRMQYLHLQVMERSTWVVSTLNQRRSMHEASSKRPRSRSGTDTISMRA